MRNHNLIFYRIRLWAEKTIIRIPPFRILLLAWAESTVADFNRNAVFNKVGRTIHLIGPNPSWAERTGIRNSVSKKCLPDH